MRTVQTTTDEPSTAALLGEYFAEREAGFAADGGYRVVAPDPARFTPPDGVFLTLEDDAQGDEGPAGCGGVRRIDDGPLGARFEVKHLFVRPSARGSGGGRLLLQALEAWARRAGAAELVLDTNRSLAEAAGLYRSSGFVAIPPYNDNPNATDWYGKALG